MGFFSRTKAVQQSVDFVEIVKQLFSGMVTNNPITRPGNFKEYLDKSYMYNATVYSIVHKIVNKAKGIPYVLYEVKDAKAYRSFINLKSCDNEYQKRKEQALEEVSDKEIEEVLKFPNPDTTYNELIEQYLIYKLILGNDFIFCSKRTTGEIIGMYTMPAQYTEIVSGQSLEPIKGYKVETYFGNEIIPKDKIIHFKNFNPAYYTDGRHLYGLSPISNAASALTLDNNAINAHLSSFINVGTRGIISPAVDGTTFGKEQADKLKDKFKKYSGPAKFNELMITSQKLSYIPIGLSPIDLAIIESQKMTTKDLCNIYSWPVQLMNNTEGSTFNNIKECVKQAMYDAVLPELDVWYEKMNNTFIASWNRAKNKNYVLGYDLQAVAELQDDMKVLMAALQPLTYLSVNEKRAALGYGESENPLHDEIPVDFGVSDPSADMNINEQLANNGGGVY